MPPTISASDAIDVAGVAMTGANEIAFDFRV
jgi:hypothetical protein